VTKPLTRTITTDPQLADIFVTELQLYQVVPVAQARGKTFSFSESVNGTAKVLLLRAPNLVYDFSTLVTHATTPNLVTYSLVNGLTSQQRLSPKVLATERVDRTDSDGGRGHESLNRLSASLAFDPIPTLGGTVAYSGQVGQTLRGTALSQSTTLFGRVDLYEGLAASASTGLSWSRDELERTTQGVQGSGSLSIVPNRYMGLYTSGSFSSSVQSGGGLPERPDHRGTFQSSISLSPFPALSVSASIQRVFLNAAPPSTLYSFGGGFSPLRGGDLQLTYQYQESLDSSSETRTRVHGPGLRWNIRRGSFLNAGYSFQTTRDPSQTQTGQAISASLVISLL
jgi:hypothetical protein